MPIDQKSILTDLKNHLRKNFGSSIKEVILFGSQARGDAEEFSDYDILIVLDKAYSFKDKNQLLELCYDIGLQHDIVIDAHFLSVNEIQSPRGKQPLFENALKSGVYA